MSRSPSPTPSESFSQDNNAWGLVLGQLIEGGVRFEVMVQDNYIELRCLSSDQLMELKNKLVELFLNATLNLWFSQPLISTCHISDSSLRSVVENVSR